MTIDELIRTGKAKIVDVRTRQEFAGGHVANSMNIPLQELPDHLQKLIELNQPLVLCCASGVRSAQAQHWLHQQGIECYNAGSWMAVNVMTIK